MRRKNENTLIRVLIKITHSYSTSLWLELDKSIWDRKNLADEHCSCIL